MLFPNNTIKLGTNTSDKFDHMFTIAGGALLSGVYTDAFSRLGVTTIHSVFFSTFLVATDFAILYGCKYLNKQKKISYDTSIAFSGFAYLSSKVVVVATLVFSGLMTASTGILAMSPLIIGILSEANKARSLHRPSSVF